MTETAAVSKLLRNESSKLRAAVMAVMTIMEEAAEAVILRGEGGVKTVCSINMEKDPIEASYSTISKNSQGVTVKV